MDRNFLYRSDGTLEKDIPQKRFAEALKDENNLLWVDLTEMEDPFVEILLNVFGLHSLTIEDFIMPNPRSKVEKFENYMFVVMHGVALNPAENIIETSELDICVGKNFVITFHPGELKSVEANRERAEKKSPIMTKGSDFLLHAIADSLVDNYLPILEDLDDKVEQVEDELFLEPTRETLNKLYTLKKDMMILRRTIGPQRDLINSLMRGEYPLIKSTTYVYFRDVYDHLVRMHDLVDTSRDILTGALEAYVSMVSNRLNEIMKVLTIFATIMLPLTVITGVYGMNFKFMPELAHKYAYPMVWLVMLLVAGSMLFFFKRRKWL